MLSKRLIIWAVCIFPAAGVITVQAGDWQEFAVFPIDATQESPDVYGYNVVWAELVEGSWNIYGTNISAPANPFDFIIAEDTDHAQYPAIYGDIVAWQFYDSYWEDWDIYITDISDANLPVEYLLTPFADDQQLPAVSGDTVAWQHGSSGDIDIYISDITEPNYPTEFLITPYAYDQQRPAIYRNSVVWQDNSYIDWDVYLTDVWRKNRPAEYPVSLGEDTDQQNIAVWGDVVVWQDNSSGNYDIVAADISEPGNPLPFDIATGALLQQNPDISGNIVVYQQFDDAGQDWDIYGYNLTTQEQFQITDSDDDEVNPAISGNVVVWQDNRDDGPWNIYAAILFGPEVAKCSAKMPGDVNNDCRVNMTDLAMMGQGWLSCQLQPQEACL
jgi:beta propeller repeat protein